MWNAITKIFAKNSSNNNRYSADEVVNMDRGDQRKKDMDDTFPSKQGKQRASMKWLLSKAYNNKVPENIREPFYRDSENQEHLKPQIAGSLSNADLYCFALGNIYSDPNYHNLNHGMILQTLARKGVYIGEPSDGAQLTETTLIQTNPLRMSAHMAVIESVMTLYAKEVFTAERVMATVQRFSHGRHAAPPRPETVEDGVIMWVSHACDALKRKIEQDFHAGVTVGAGGDRLKIPDMPSIIELKDLNDGVALAALVSYYCPDELPWTELRVSNVPTVQESMYNLSLLEDFCNRCLPSSIFHLSPEDVTYMRDSMKPNLLVFLADLFNVLEIHPANCVRYPGIEKYANDHFPPSNEHGVVHKRNLLQTVMVPIPDLRSGIDNHVDATAFQASRSAPPQTPLRKTHSLQHSISDMSEDSLFNKLPKSAEDSSFVVHRGKNVPTLRNLVANDEPLVPARLKVTKEKQNYDSKEDERGEQRTAGKPSHWEDSRKNTTFAGRRSRRNSTSDDSQLTIENFGGSQDNLNFIGRNPDKEVAVHVGRKISAPSFPVQVPVVPVRSSLQDARGSIQLGYDNGCEKQDNVPEKFILKRQLSSDDIALRKRLISSGFDEKENLLRDLVDGEISNRISFADLNSKPQKSALETKNIHLVYMQQENDEPSKPKLLVKNGQNGTEKKTSFAALPNTTTWQQQQINHQQLNSDTNGGGVAEENGVSNNMNAQLSDIRLKLEEKRRHIENEKRKMEVAMGKQRQKVGKAAFLQAVTKGKGNLLKTPTDTDSNSNSNEGSDNQSPSSSSDPVVSNKSEKPFSLKDATDEAALVEQKWLDIDQPYMDTRRTPDLENMDIDQYQHSIAQMNSSLQDIHTDIQRLATQQSEIQSAQQQNIIAQQQKQIQTLQHQQHNHQQSFQNPQYSPQQPHQQQQQQQQQHQYSPAHYHNPSPIVYRPPLQTSASAPHIPQPMYAQQPQFFLHDGSTPQPSPPAIPQRRTWAQQAHQPPQPIYSDFIHSEARHSEPLHSERRLSESRHSEPRQLEPRHSEPYRQNQPELRTWGKPQNPSGFVLHDNPERSQYPLRYSENSRYQNGDGHPIQHSNSFTLSQLHHNNYQQQQQHPVYGTSHSTPSASPQHRSSVQRQISQLMDDVKRDPVSLQQMELTPSQRKSSVTHAPIPAPSADDMEPQNISFIGNADELHLNEGISKLNITSGTRTYRIPSPTRPILSRNAFQPSPPPNRDKDVPTQHEVSSLENDATNQKGFYISFDNEQPKRPKPPLRTKRGSPKKEGSFVESEEGSYFKRKAEQDRLERKKQLEKELAEVKFREEEKERHRQDIERNERLRKREASQERQRVQAASAIIIGNELSNPDPDLIDEREKKKEKIMLLSLQRRQQQEESKRRKEQEVQYRKEQEKAKEEDKARKKEEQAARRAAILEQYKMKKAIEEAEREGKVIDKSEFMGTLKPTPKMRPKGLTRPRPKTIHIDSGSVEMAEGMLQPSRGKKGSTSNLTAHSFAPSTMRRDYFRGSQDSLADRSMTGLHYRDSPDDSRGMSPCHSANQTLGRRSSYKTSRDPSPAQARGRSKFSTNQNLKGRKSSSLMNLYGSSTDQDSFAYRYGDTDSGLGRATPPRRAPSPGMGSMRHLPSPSGPGSLPGLMSKGRRMFDDGSSDISSTPSSMMDYNGPRLYKQPATKSNRGIMLNAVEYCVFPGVVNRDAKRRVLEEINRSDGKHFLILFRDERCQFRALYSYCPDREEIAKLYGTGPKQVNDGMFDKFFKYNSGGKCFSQIHTKHLTVTIDAFTIHNSLWQGKKVNLPNKKDMALVI